MGMVHFFTAKRAFLFSYLVLLSLTCLALIFRCEPILSIVTSHRTTGNHAVKCERVDSPIQTDIVDNSGAMKPRIQTEIIDNSGAAELPIQTDIVDNSGVAELSIQNDIIDKSGVAELPIQNDVIDKSGDFELPKQNDIIDNSGAIEYLNKYKEVFYTNKDVDIETPNPNKSETVKNWWQAAACMTWYMNAPLRYTCQNKTRKGNWFICQDQNYLIKPPCLVYSFGIAFDFSFDNAMVKLGCEVHSFDPSMNKESFKRGNNSYFYNIGLGAYNTDGFSPRRDMYVKKAQVWKLRTVKSIMKMLGHQNRVLDVLKIDIETSEWTVLDNLLESDILPSVRQLLVEFHLFAGYPHREDYVYLYNTYTRVREMGFQEFYARNHQHRMKVDKYNNQGDISFVNKFFQRPTDFRQK